MSQSASALAAGLVAVFVVAGGAGCASAPPPHVQRATTDGVETGPYVSPYQYEHYLRGELALAEGQPAVAAAEFALARTGSADDAFLRARHAQALTEAGDWERAGRVLDDSLTLFPGSLDLHLAQARWAEGQGRDDEALGALRRAEQVAPRSPLAPLAHATLLSRLGRDDEAQAVLEAFLLRSADPQARAVRLELALRRGDLDLAVQLVRASPPPPGAPTSVVRVAQLALERGRPDLAIDLLQRSTRADERVLRIRAYAQAGRYEEAEAQLAVAQDGDLGGVEERAALYLLVRRADVALELLGESVARPEAAAPREALLIGACLLQLGRPSEAASWLARVPRDSTDGAAARTELVEALRVAGLPALAGELLARTARP